MQISRNEELLNYKIGNIAVFVDGHAYQHNEFMVKDVSNEMINLYEVILSILQDIETSNNICQISNIIFQYN